MQKIRESAHAKKRGKKKALSLFFSLSPAKGALCKHREKRTPPFFLLSMRSRTEREGENSDGSRLSLPLLSHSLSLPLAVYAYAKKRSFHFYRVSKSRCCWKLDGSVGGRECHSSSSSSLAAKTRGRERGRDAAWLTHPLSQHSKTSLKTHGIKVKHKVKPNTITKHWLF